MTRNRWLGLLGRYLLVAPHRLPRALRVPAFRARNVGLQEWPVQALADVPHVGTVACGTEDMIQRYLYLFGVWEPGLSALVRRQLSAGDVFIDVGANIGYYSLLAARVVGETGQVIAFEPSPTVRAQLTDNLERNGLSARVQVQPVAAGEAAATVTIYLAGADNLGQTSTRPGAGLTAEAEVPMVRVDDCVPPDVRARVKALKIDTEGDELAALRGATGLLREMPLGSMVLVELDAPRMAVRGGSPPEACALLEALGYRGHVVDNPYDVASYVRGRLPELRPLGADVRTADLVFVRVAVQGSEAA
ncbi:MAG: hypothetical protein JWN77_3126 [Frankiales bacterium]|jgi:FkbM family methyltransferase|nr:hypothetical protein [Frankiales bacterium]